MLHWVWPPPLLKMNVIVVTGILGTPDVYTGSIHQPCAVFSEGILMVPDGHWKTPPQV